MNLIIKVLYRLADGVYTKKSKDFMEDYSLNWIARGVVWVVLISLFYFLMKNIFSAVALGIYLDMTVVDFYTSRKLGPACNAMYRISERGSQKETLGFIFYNGGFWLMIFLILNN